MIFAQDYEDMLRRTGKEFFVSEIRYVSNLLFWSRERGITLSEPFQPIKLVTEDMVLRMFVQSEIPENMLDNVITGLSVRWSVRDNMSDISKKLNSVKKRLAYCLLKECARSVGSLDGDELLEDEWAVGEMEKQGFFLE